MNDEILVPLDLADAIAMIDRQKEQITALTTERERLQRARIGDAEIIGRWQCETETLTAEKDLMKKCLFPEQLKIIQSNLKALQGVEESKDGK